MGFGMNNAAKTITGGVVQTIGWTSAEIPGSPPQGPYVNRWILSNTGANNSLNNAVAQVRVKANSQEIWNVPAAHVRAFHEATNPANNIDTAGRLSFTLQMGLQGRYTRDQYATAYPIGSAPAVEFDVAAGSSAGVSVIGWGTARTRPTHWTKWLSKATGVGANANPGRVNIELPAGELLYGIGLPLTSATGITQARLYIGNAKEAELTQGMILESQFDTNPQSVTTTFFWIFDEALPLSAMPAANYLELITGAASLVGDIISFMTLVPQPAIA